jgi:hypothetical protein
MRTLLKGSLFAMSALALAGTALAQGDNPDNGGRKIAASLTGGAEVPGPADSDGVGLFEARVNPGTERICYTLTASSIDAATVAHIHSGAAGAAGPPVLTLDTPRRRRRRQRGLPGHRPRPRAVADPEPGELLRQRSHRAVPERRDPRPASQGLVTGTTRRKPRNSGISRTLTQCPRRTSHGAGLAARTSPWTRHRSGATRRLSSFGQPPDRSAQRTGRGECRVS